MLTGLGACILLGCASTEGTFSITCEPELESLHDPGVSFQYVIDGEIFDGGDPEMREQLTLIDSTRQLRFLAHEMSSTLNLQPSTQYTFIIRQQDHALLEVRDANGIVYRYKRKDGILGLLSDEPFLGERSGE